jgi:hypothetical protein
MDLALAPGVEASSMKEGGGRDWDACCCMPEGCGQGKVGGAKVE